MSSSARLNNHKFLYLALGVYAGAAAALVGLQKPGLDLAHYQAGVQAAIAEHSSGAVALGRYRLALALDPGNQRFHVKTAELYMRQGRGVEALKQVAGASGKEANVVRSEAYLDAGNNDAAIKEVGEGSSTVEQTQLALSDGVTGKLRDLHRLQQDGKADPSVLTHAQAGGVALAQELYKRGLYFGAQRVATNAPDSAAKYLLLASALLAQPGEPSAVVAAKAAAEQGIRVAPANVALHQQLLEIDQKLGDGNDIRQEQQRLDALQNGRI